MKKTTKKSTKKSTKKTANKIQPKTIVIWSVFLILFFTSSYQTYALLNINSQLAQNGISFGTSKTSYNFASGGDSLAELPDMAGGC